MTFRLWKSPEGVREAAKTGKPYEDHINDQLFAHHQQLIQNDPNKTEVINSITRVKTFDGNEYLVYSETSTGRDSVYNKRHSFFRDGLGKYLQVETETIRVPNEEFTNNPTTGLEFDIDGNPKNAQNISMFKEINQVIAEHEAYSIPFTKENLDKLHVKCKDKGSARPEEITSYEVAMEGGRSILVTGGYEQFRNGDFETLFNYGCIPSNAEEKYRIDSMRMSNRVSNIPIPTMVTSARPAENPSLMEAFI